VTVAKGSPPRDVPLRRPPGTPALSADLKLADAPGTHLYGFLVRPDGETSAQGVTTDDGSGNQVMQLHYIDPLPGRWMFEEHATDPVGGTSIAPSFTGHVSLWPFPVTAETVPTGPWSRIRAGASQTASVTVANPGPGPVNVFLDARGDTTTRYALVPLNQATNLTLPSTHGGRDFMVPGQTTTLQAVVNATAPVDFNWGFLRPTPVTIPPQGSATLTVTFAPTAVDGRSAAGDLFVVDDVTSAPAFNELAEIPNPFEVG
jgi:hypothetical protein